MATLDTAAKQPIDGNSRRGLAPLGGYVLQDIDNIEQLTVMPGQPAHFRHADIGMGQPVPGDLTGQLAARERTPGDGTYTLIEADRHERSARIAFCACSM